jgi:hypothetical protein
MNPCATAPQTRATHPPEPAPGPFAPTDLTNPLAAPSAERVHSVLRGMAEDDWSAFKSLLSTHPHRPAQADEIEVLEGLFRRGDPIGGRTGGVVLQLVHTIITAAPLAQAIRAAHERIRTRIRFALREMSDESWEAFQAALQRTFTDLDAVDGLAVLALVFRIGESVTNIETAAAALADKLSGSRRLQPEVARHNALMRARTPGASALDPEAAYQAAKEALEKAEQAARRAESTLASRYVRPGLAYRHARSTVFRLIGAIAENRELLAQIDRIDADLHAVPPLTREQLRWALHRMPDAERLKVIRLIPLNTILMFQNGEGSGTQDLEFKAARDRRLAYDFFARGQGEAQLMRTYGLTLNAVKNALGALLQSLLERPLARKTVHDFLGRVKQIEPMPLQEVRWRLKRLPPGRKAEIVHAVPSCAWKQRDVMSVHKHLFLDYFGGDWVLNRLVDYYNLEKGKRLTGTFRFDGTLTVRGANAAIEGMLGKIAEEPLLRQRLRQWTSAQPDPVPPAAPAGAEETELDSFLLPLPLPVS